MARHDPVALHFIVHTAPAGVLGTDVACVHVDPASAVMRKLPTRLAGVFPAPPPPAAWGNEPPTLSTQWVALPQANRPK